MEQMNGNRPVKGIEVYEEDMAGKPREHLMKMQHENYVVCAILQC